MRAREVAESNAIQSGLPHDRLSSSVSGVRGTTISDPSPTNTLDDQSRRSLLRSVFLGDFEYSAAAMSQMRYDAYDCMLNPR